MSHHAERLVDMANQISHFFEAQPTREEAVAGVLAHMQRFWEPRMKRTIVEHLSAGGEGLREVAAAAVARLAQDRSAHGTTAPSG